MSAFTKIGECYPEKKYATYRHYMCTLYDPMNPIPKPTLTLLLMIG